MALMWTGSASGSRVSSLPRSRERRILTSGGENGAGFMPDSPAAPAAPVAPDARPSGTLSAAISNAVVGLLHNYTGRGPTRARTTIGADTIVVTLRDSLTKAERTLADHGQSLEVLAMRRAFQGAMRDDLVAAVEKPHRPHRRGVPQRQPA